MTAAVAFGNSSLPSSLPSRELPCPCGSGRKYKRCHFRADVVALVQAGVLPDHAKKVPQSRSVRAVSRVLSDKAEPGPSAISFRSSRRGQALNSLGPNPGALRSDLALIEEMAADPDDPISEGSKAVLILDAIEDAAPRGAAPISTMTAAVAFGARSQRRFTRADYRAICLHEAPIRKVLEAILGNPDHAQVAYRILQLQAFWAKPLSATYETLGRKAAEGFGARVQLGLVAYEPPVGGRRAQNIPNRDLANRLLAKEWTTRTVEKLLQRSLIGKQRLFRQHREGEILQGRPPQHGFLEWVNELDVSALWRNLCRQLGALLFAKKWSLRRLEVKAGSQWALFEFWADGQALTGLFDRGTKRAVPNLSPPAPDPGRFTSGRYGKVVRS